MSKRAFRAALALVAAGAFLPVTTVAAAPARARRVDPVLMTITSVSPATPQPSHEKQPLTVQLTLMNTTDKPIEKVRVVGVRGDPIARQVSLDAALADTTPAGNGEPIAPTRPVTVDLPAGQPVPVNFVTSTNIPQDAGICLCADGVYPLYFSAHVTTPGGADERIGTAPTTFLPSFLTKPKPVQVSWVWPLIDRPHRLVDDAVFTDDDLAQVVMGDGRLSRALQVVEAVGSDVPMTLVIDPELLDELEVMSTLPYTVRTGSERPTPGTGQAAATEWLNRLRAVLENDPNVEVDLTPYADPDVESLEEQGLTWATALPSIMRTRVTQALGSRVPQTDIAWPAGGAVSPRTLGTLARAGASTVILDSSSVIPRTAAGRIPASLTTLDTADRSVTAALTTSAIGKYVASTISLGGTGAKLLPQLVAELAVRVAQVPTAMHTVLMAPPRYVDPSPEIAGRAIIETTTSPFTTAVGLRAAIRGAGSPAPSSRLAHVPASTPQLPNGILDHASSVSTGLPAVRAMLVKSLPAQPLVAAFPLALQRVESSAWRPDSSVGGPVIGSPRAQQLAAQVSTILSNVRIVSPSSGSYTLASSNSPLPITVENKLDYAVVVSVQVTTVGGLPGFTARELLAQRVEPHQKQTLRVPTHVERSGRIRIQAELTAPDGTPLGTIVPLSVHSTVLGTVGVVITVVAGVILVLALLFRFLRRLRKRRTPTPEAGEPSPAPAPGPDPVRR